MFWVLVAWNVVIVVWSLAGHPGVKGSTGEGVALADATIVVLWLIGNLALGTAWWVSRRLHRHVDSGPGAD